MSLPGQIVATLKIAGRNGGLRLIHKLLYLTDHILLAGRQLASRKLLEVIFGSGRKLFGGTLLRRWIAICTPQQLNRRLVGTSVADNFFRRRTRLRGCARRRIRSRWRIRTGSGFSLVMNFVRRRLGLSRCIGRRGLPSLSLSWRRRLRLWLVRRRRLLSCLLHGPRTGQSGTYPSVRLHTRSPRAE